MSRRDELTAIARATGVLLRRRRPSELARELLVELLAVFHARGGLLFLTRPEDQPVLAAVGLDREPARELAAEFVQRLDAVPSGHAAWRAANLPAVPAGAGTVLATPLARASGPAGALAVFSSGPRDFEPDRDGRLLTLVARNAVSALDGATEWTRASARAERLAIRAEQLERIHQGLEHHSREVEHSLAARSRFFAAMSHELRTPINAILGYNELLRDSVLGPLSTRQADVLDKVAASARQLLALVNDILDLSKIEAGKVAVRRHPVDVHEVVGEAAQTIELQARDKGLDFRVELAHDLPAVHTDSTRVRQILLNLLSNAVKFTPAGSVTVRVNHLRPGSTPAGGSRPSCRPGSRGWLAVAVEDTGVGIPPEKIETIFDEFVQIPSQQGRDGGTGLGLAISSRLARMLGGELTVESAVGEHSVFTLFLPCPSHAVDEPASGAA